MFALTTVRRRPRSLFDDFFEDFRPAPGWPAGRGLVAGTFAPRVDVSETDKHLKIAAELPGIEEKDVSVEVEDAAVIISGERSAEKEEEHENWHYREQTYGSFRRVVPLSVGVDAAKAKARFKKGILTVTLPKLPEEQETRKQVPIETG